MQGSVATSERPLDDDWWDGNVRLDSRNDETVVRTSRILSEWSPSTIVSPNRMLPLHVVQKNCFFTLFTGTSVAEILDSLRFKERTCRALSLTARCPLRKSLWNSRLRGIPHDSQKKSVEWADGSIKITHMRNFDRTGQFTVLMPENSCCQNPLNQMPMSSEFERSALVSINASPVYFLSILHPHYTSMGRVSCKFVFWGGIFQYFLSFPIGIYFGARAGEILKSRHGLRLPLETQRSLSKRSCNAHTHLKQRYLSGLWFISIASS